MKIDPNAPAYPVNEETTDRLIEGITIYSGLSIRAELAARAMQGLLSGMSHLTTERVAFSAEYIAEFSVLCADALISELNKEE